MPIADDKVELLEAAMLRAWLDFAYGSGAKQDLGNAIVAEKEVVLKQEEVAEATRSMRGTWLVGAQRQER